MIELGQDAALGSKGLGGRAGQMSMDKLDGDDLLEPAIVAFPAPYVTHAAIADAFGQAERADTLRGLDQGCGRAPRDLGRHSRPGGMGQFKLRDAVQNHRRLGLQQACAKTQIVGTGREPLEQIKRTKIDFRCGLGHLGNPTARRAPPANDV